MPSKKFVIITACNDRAEGFLINHWLRSLTENVDLSNISVAVLDFGLSLEAKRTLNQRSVEVVETSRRNGIVNNLRFLEARDFLLKRRNEYSQVLICDSGDLIFQTDISPVFEVCPTKLRAVRERVSPNMDLLIRPEDVNIELSEIRSIVTKRPLLNVGLIVSPTEMFIDIVGKMESVALNLHRWGLETILLNYFAEKDNLVCELDVGYNFIPVTALEKYWIKDSKFWFRNGELIPVVHNAGGSRILRPIMNFGYGEGRNKPKRLTIFILRNFYKLLSHQRASIRRIGRKRGK